MDNSPRSGGSRGGRPPNDGRRTGRPPRDDPPGRDGAAGSERGGRGGPPGSRGGQTRGSGQRGGYTGGQAGSGDRGARRPPPARAETPAGPHSRDDRSERTVVPFGPAIPEWATEGALDSHVLREFEALGERRSSEVARRLVAAHVAADEGDYDTALGHVAVVRVVGARLAAAREACGIIAYRCERYDLASKDLKAARRISGRDETLPVVADCERGLGRPERALELAASPEASRLDLEGRVEMLLVAAGARQDLGQADAAVLTLQVPELQGSHRHVWHYRLVAGYAEALHLAGRLDEAERWRATAERHPAAPAQVTGPGSAHGRQDDADEADDEEFDFVDAGLDDDGRPIVLPDEPTVDRGPEERTSPTDA